MLCCSSCGSINKKVADIKETMANLSNLLVRAFKKKKKEKFFSLNQVAGAVRQAQDDKGLAEANLAYGATFH